MRTLYIDCGMGAAGDMLTAALIELLPDPDAFLAELNALGIPGVSFTREKTVKCGIMGTHVNVLVHGREESDHGHPVSHEHVHHADLPGIRQIVTTLPLPAGVRDNALTVYDRIADAEARVHGVPVSDVHFHEVGAMDAVADVTAVCLLIDRLRPEEIVVSPVHVGSGHVRCAHGILPVPAPAAAELLKGVPIYGGSVEGELCTPTGAALLTHFASRFGDMPVMEVSAIGCGMGKKDFDIANCLRVFLGDTRDSGDTICVLSCSVDDMTAEEIGFAMERLFEAGAREVLTIPVGMKKSRPGTLIQVFCDREDQEKMARLIFLHTTTIGIRKSQTERLILDRKTEVRRTPFGDVRIKHVSGYGVSREKSEYEDLARIAREQDISIAEARMLTEGE